MGLNRIGEDIQISGTVSSAGFYGPLFGDGSGITNLPGGFGATGPTGPSGATGPTGPAGPGGLTGSGTANYIAKFTSAGVLADSNIQDSGYPNGIGINYAPQAGTILAIGNAIQPTTQYILNNYGTSSTTTVLQLVSIGPGTGSHIGIDVFVPTGSNNYGMKLQDGRQAAGYVLTSDASGNAYWAAPTGGGGGATPSLAQVLSVGAQANTAINMNGNSIYSIDQIGIKAPYGAGYIEFATPAINLVNATMMTLMYNT